MTWTRSTAAPALAAALENQSDGTVAIYAAPPATLNVPAAVVGHVLDVTYATAGLGLDTVQLPVICVGQLFDGEEQLEELTALVRSAVVADPQLAGTVSSVTANGERNWRAVKIGGADFMAVDVVLDIRQ
jgi:hypothetical protein